MPISNKFSLELNSHSLSHIQMCEKRYQYEEISLLRDKREYYPFKRGAGISKYLAYWYMARKKGYVDNKLMDFEFRLMKRMAHDNSFVNINYGTDDKLHISSRLMGYFNKYRNETYKPVAIEKPFTKIIYEDNNVLFAYSGRPDLILDYGQFGVGPMDHKSESRESNIATFNNQFAGYCWATNARIGMVNYIGLQLDSKDNKVLRREAFTFTESQLNRWKSDTIEWYFRAMHSIVNKKFLRSWRCEGKYSLCTYYKLCTSGSRNEERIKIKRDYIKIDKPYQSW